MSKDTHLVGIDSLAKPRALPERIKAVIRLRQRTFTHVQQVKVKSSLGDRRLQGKYPQQDR